MPDSDQISLLRHTVATVAYRGGKAVRGAPPDFAGFRAGPQTRTPGEIVAHIGDLFDWALSLVEGTEEWHNSRVLPWDRAAERFFAALGAFDRRLASGPPFATSAERLFQGPVADALSHIGQLTMLRRLAGAPVRGENYFTAEITAGRTGADQAPPRFEFD